MPLGGGRGLSGDVARPEVETQLRDSVDAIARGVTHHDHAYLEGRIHADHVAESRTTANVFDKSRVLISLAGGHSSHQRRGPTSFFKGEDCGLSLPDGVGRYQWTLAGSVLHFTPLGQDPALSVAATSAGATRRGVPRRSSTQTLPVAGVVSMPLPGPRSRHASC
jgi:hypothetical protein